MAHFPPTDPYQKQYPPLPSPAKTPSMPIPRLPHHRMEKEFPPLQSKIVSPPKVPNRKDTENSAKWSSFILGSSLPKKESTSLPASTSPSQVSDELAQFLLLMPSKASPSIDSMTALWKQSFSPPPNTNNKLAARSVSPNPTKAWGSPSSQASHPESADKDNFPTLKEASRLPSKRRSSDTVLPINSQNLSDTLWKDSFDGYIPPKISPSKSSTSPINTKTQPKKIAWSPPSTASTPENPSTSNEFPTLQTASRLPITKQKKPSHSLSTSPQIENPTDNLWQDSFPGYSVKKQNLPPVAEQEEWETAADSFVLKNLPSQPAPFDLEMPQEEFDEPHKTAKPPVTISTETTEPNNEEIVRMIRLGKYPVELQPMTLEEIEKATKAPCGPAEIDQTGLSIDFRFPQNTSYTETEIMDWVKEKSALHVYNRLKIFSIVCEFLNRNKRDIKKSGLCFPTKPFKNCHATTSRYAPPSLTQNAFYNPFESMELAHISIFSKIFLKRTENDPIFYLIKNAKVILDDDKVVDLHHLLNACDYVPFYLNVIDLLCEIVIRPYSKSLFQAALETDSITSLLESQSRKYLWTLHRLRDEVKKRNDGSKLYDDWIAPYQLNEKRAEFVQRFKSIFCLENENRIAQRVSCLNGMIKGAKKFQQDLQEKIATPPQIAVEQKPDWLDAFLSSSLK